MRKLSNESLKRLAGARIGDVVQPECGPILVSKVQKIGPCAGCYWEKAPIEDCVNMPCMDIRGIVYKLNDSSICDTCDGETGACKGCSMNTYRTSKDYERLIDLIEDGETILGTRGESIYKNGTGYWYIKVCTNGNLCNFASEIIALCSERDVEYVLPTEAVFDYGDTTAEALQVMLETTLIPESVRRLAEERIAEWRKLK